MNCDNNKHSAPLWTFEILTKLQPYIYHYLGEHNLSRCQKREEENRREFHFIVIELRVYDPI